jgi:predicted DNA binding CopG/RHH family protein
MKLSQDEKDLLESVERGEWETIPNLNRETERYQKYAKATFRKDKRVNIRISEKDLVRLQKKALQEGLPYQTLIASVLHKYITGQFKEKGI